MKTERNLASVIDGELYTITTLYAYCMNIRTFHISQVENLVANDASYKQPQLSNL